MGYKFVITKDALKDFATLDSVVAKRIIKKLEWFEKQSNPVKHAAPLRDSVIGDIRFRIGDYRAIAVVDEKRMLITIVMIGHRREIY